jgi:hypothetical protein
MHTRRPALESLLLLRDLAMGEVRMALPSQH